MSKVKDIVLIIKDVSRIIADLVRYQAEPMLHLCKQTLIRIMVWVLMVLTAIMLAMSGLGMILWAIYLQLSLVMGQAGSACMLGGFLIMAAVIIFLIARNTLKD